MAECEGLNYLLFNVPLPSLKDLDPFTVFIHNVSTCLLSHGLNFVNDLIDKAVLNVYPSREGSSEITHQFLIGWRFLACIVLKHF